MSVDIGKFKINEVKSKRKEGRVEGKPGLIRLTKSFVKEQLRDSIRDPKKRNYHFPLEGDLLLQYPMLTWVLEYFKTKEVAESYTKKKLQFLLDCFIFPESKHHFIEADESSSRYKDFFTFFEEFISILRISEKKKIKFEKRREEMLSMVHKILRFSPWEKTEKNLVRRFYETIQRFCSQKELSIMLDCAESLIPIVDIYRGTGRYDKVSKLIESVSDYYINIGELSYSRWLYRFLLDIINNEWKRNCDTHDDFSLMNDHRIKCESSLYQMEGVSKGYTNLPVSCIRLIFEFRDFLVLKRKPSNQRKTRKLHPMTFSDSIRVFFHKKTVIVSSKKSDDPEKTTRSSSTSFINIHPNISIEANTEEELFDGKMYFESVWSFMPFLPNEIHILRIPLLSNSSNFRFPGNWKYERISELQITSGDLNQELFENFLFLNRLSIRIIRTETHHHSGSTRTTNNNMKNLERNLGEITRLESLRLGGKYVSYNDLFPIEKLKHLKRLTLPKVEFSNNKRNNNSYRNVIRFNEFNNNKDGKNDNERIIKLPLSLEELQIGKHPQQGYQNDITRQYIPQMRRENFEKQGGGEMKVSRTCGYTILGDFTSYGNLKGWEYFFHFRLKKITFHNCYFDHDVFPPLPPGLQHLKLVNCRTKLSINLNALRGNNINNNNNNNRRRRNNNNSNNNNPFNFGRKRFKFMRIEYPQNLRFLTYRNVDLDFKDATTYSFDHFQKPLEEMEWRDNRVFRKDVRNMICSGNIKSVRLEDIVFKVPGGRRRMEDVAIEGGIFDHKIYAKFVQKGKEYHHHQQQPQYTQKSSMEHYNTRRYLNTLKKIVIINCPNLSDLDLMEIPPRVETLRIINSGYETTTTTKSKSQEEKEKGDDHNNNNNRRGYIDGRFIVDGLGWVTGLRELELVNLRSLNPYSLPKICDNARELRDLRLHLTVPQIKIMKGELIRNKEFEFAKLKKLRKVVMNFEMGESKVRRCLRSVQFCSFGGIEWVRIHGYLVRNI